MSTDSNKDLVRRLWYDELWNRWNTAAADDLFSQDYALHLPGLAVPLDREATKQVVQMFGAAFPDLVHTVDEMIAEGSSVCGRWTVRGTHRGEFQGLPPTGRSVVLSGLTVHHVSGNRITETWLAFDSATLTQQLADPAPAP